jgi:hypothetical protein
MGDNKISEAASAEECLRAFNETLTPALRVPYTMAYRIAMGAAMEAAAAHLQGEAVPVAWLIYWSNIPLEAPEVTTSASRVDAVSALTGPPRIEPLYTHPQPAELNEVSGNSGELGTGRYDRRVDLIARLYMARDMERAGAWSYLFAEAADALAATGKQQVGEVQGAREQFEAWAKKDYFIRRNDSGDYIEPATEDAWGIWQAAIASRQPVGAQSVYLGWMKRLGNDGRINDDSYEEAIKAARSHIGARRPDDDEPEDQWYWDKLTSLLALIDGRDAGAGVKL